ncbi:unnamed protein product [Vitrella brassicaformis CCMP3155]|uniref:Uncharacterized protein n=1 Tax=Vitrella brassicaformis (strain CCMP3155) TaxID=1169540 RepID=A0A0G4FPN9_VITBC|nr:unnamed protein product [Vitrella brassicaformis CCMP3155]|eukprot:CEM16422.1 unnamed protein product [Vitrella brassicaformis CCMP3155]
MASSSVPSLWAISLEKASHLLDDQSVKRPAVLSQMDKQPPTEIPKGVTLPVVLQQRIEQAMQYDDLHAVLAFDIRDVAGAIKAAYVLERCSGQWTMMKRFIRLAFIHRLTPPNATLPLMLSADALPSASAFDELPLSMAVYKSIERTLNYRGTTLVLQRGNNCGYRIGDHSFRVMALDELPADHPYRSRYKESDPVIRWGDFTFPSSTAFLTWMILVQWCAQEGVEKRQLASVYVWRGDSRYQSLLTLDDIPEASMIIDYMDEHSSPIDDARRRLILLRGTAPTDTVAAYLWLRNGDIRLYTTERDTAAAARPLLARHRLEQQVLGHVRGAE